MKITLPGAVDVDINKDDYEILQKIANSDFAGLIVGDWIRFWRWKNLTKIATKTREICEAQGLNPEQVAPKFISEFFESSSLEENEDIQEMWANLLLNRSVNKNTNIYYIHILKELEPIEARILSSLYKEAKDDVEASFSFDKTDKQKWMSTAELKIMIHKLYSFNILRPPVLKGAVYWDANDNYAPALETISMFRFTEMGIDFCKKCNGLEVIDIEDTVIE